MMKHVFWLFKNGTKCFLCGDLEGAIEAAMLIKLHISYPHKKIR